MYAALPNHARKGMDLSSKGRGAYTSFTESSVAGIIRLRSRSSPWRRSLRSSHLQRARYSREAHPQTSYSQASLGAHG